MIKIIISIFFSPSAFTEQEYKLRTTEYTIIKIQNNVTSYHYMGKEKQIEANLIANRPPNTYETKHKAVSLANTRVHPLGISVCVSDAKMTE